MAELGSVECKQASLSGLREITIDLPFEVICPVPKMPYGGTLTVCYVPEAKDGLVHLLEWNSLEQWLRGQRRESYLAEELACRVLDMVMITLEDFVERIQVTVNVTSSYHLPVKVVAYLEA